MALNYSVSTVAGTVALFEKAYSYIQLRVEVPAAGIKPALYVSLPVSVANDEHIQRVFKRADGASPALNAVFFDVYFPLLSGLNTLDILVYPEGSDPTTMDNSTQGYPYSIDLTKFTKAQGSTLLLGLEDKEQNVRVLPIADGISPQVLAPSYTWTATILPEATAKISGAIAHVTELFETNFIKNNNFTAVPDNLITSFDPSRSKYHLYFRSGADGLATLTIAIPKTPSWGHLIYWPFADNASEVARIVFYNQNRFGLNLFGPDPQKNPITLSNYDDKSGPVFNIRNAQDPKAIKAGPGNSIYFLINDSYDKTLPAQSADIFETMTSKKLIKGSTGSLPQSNTARIVYAENNGNVSSSPKYSFFAFK